MSMINVKGLKKSFKNHEVLKGIDIEIQPGEVVAIVGPSGCGKSTFLRCLNLLESPTKGTITFEGTPITDPKTNIDLIRRQMGMVFQHFNLFPGVDVLGDVVQHQMVPEGLGQVFNVDHFDAASFPEYPAAR